MQEGELSADLYNFHEAVSQLQQQEDEMLDFHKDLIDLQDRWMAKDLELFNSTREVDYDQDGIGKIFILILTIFYQPCLITFFSFSAYSARLESLIKEKLEVLSRFEEKVTSFRAQLVAEEQFSQKVKPRTGRYN